MASAATLLEDIGENFCQCCLCFERYKDPRQLPCFHRYCSGCLDQEIARNHGELKCPLCQQDVEVPEDGAKGLKKDFFMNEIIDFLEMKKSFQEEAFHKCGDCSQDVKATSYCFRCSYFLCGKCMENHLTMNSLKSHRPFLLTLGDLASQNLTLQKFSSMKDAPMCQTHCGHMSILCCKTCENMPICVACTYGDHKTHEIEDVISFARVAREKLKSRLVLLNESKGKVYQIAQKAVKLKKVAIETADKTIQEIYDKSAEELTKIEKELESFCESHSCAVETIKQKGKDNSAIRKQQLEDKIEQIRKEHERQEQNHQREIEAEIAKADEMYAKKKSKLERKLETILKEVKDGQSLIENEKSERVTETEKAIVNIGNTIKRLENLTETGSNILASENDWTAIQNSDHICLASDPLLQDIGRAYPNLDKAVKYSRIRLFTCKLEKNRISEKPELDIDIEDIKNKGWYINGVAATENGTIVITGGTVGERKAHISVIDRNGKLLTQTLIGSKYPDPLCCCVFFKGDKIAIACDVNIGLYSVRDNSYHKVNLRDIVRKAVNLDFITAYGVDNLIIVGCRNESCLYVLDDRLKLTGTINIPAVIRSHRHIGMNDNNIFVCDENNKEAYGLDMKGQLLYKFTKPDSVDCRLPFSVCTDIRGLVYILWVQRVTSSKQNCVLAQYDPADGRLMAKLATQNKQGWITTVKNDSGEKILLSSQHSGKLRVHSLNET